MARKRRCDSVTGYQHVIIRGNNKQVLYESDEDYRFFIKRMGRYTREEEVGLSAYCLMENHAHILVKGPQANISRMMQKLEVSYSKYFLGS